MVKVSAEPGLESPPSVCTQERAAGTARLAMVPWAGAGQCGSASGALAGCPPKRYCWVMGWGVGGRSRVGSTDRRGLPAEF